MSPVRVWAPRARAVSLVREGASAQDLRATEGGWWVGEGALAHGERYAVCVDGADPVPDPHACRLPDGPHGFAAAYDHSVFAWRDDGWRGRLLADAVVYELHVGTFTPGGTFAAAVERLPHLVALGVTHVEVMPVAAWDGPRGWGYDGVAPWAVQESYGGPDGLKHFVDACHAAGLCVVLDVVQNHLGPSGAYLPRFAPYFTAEHSTPWGEAVNLDGPGSDVVRAYLIDTVRMWVRDYHIDGLRLDAVHELPDDRAVHILEEISAAVDALCIELGRTVNLVAESDRNDPLLVTPRPRHGLGVHAHWADDVHHALHVLLTGESGGYYADFAVDPFAATGKALAGVYVHDGTWSSFRGRTHGRPVDRTELPGWRFVTCLQNHDQVGNRARGDRLSATVSTGRLAAGAALLLCGPTVPMVFMGEEWGARTPWQFFTSFPDPELAAAVTKGRRAEFAAHGWPPGDVPDPQDPATFAASVLDWSEPSRSEHTELLDWYRRLIALRRATADLRDPRLLTVAVAYDRDAGWLRMDRGGYCVVVNLAGTVTDVPLPGAADVELCWRDGADVVVDPPGVRLAPESAAVLRLA